jgi:hypothetical protein
MPPHGLPGSPQGQRPSASAVRSRYTTARRCWHTATGRGGRSVLNTHRETVIIILGRTYAGAVAAGGVVEGRRDPHAAPSARGGPARAASCSFASDLAGPGVAGAARGDGASRSPGGDAADRHSWHDLALAPGHRPPPLGAIVAPGPVRTAPGRPGWAEFLAQGILRWTSSPPTCSTAPRSTSWPPSSTAPAASGSSEPPGTQPSRG